VKCDRCGNEIPARGGIKLRSRAWVIGAPDAPELYGSILLCWACAKGNQGDAFSHEVAALEAEVKGSTGGVV
jgi:hypothetical protein